MPVDHPTEKMKEHLMKMNRKGFTLVEIMIVVAIIGVLAAIAIPNFVKSRRESQKNACISNMKQIIGAIEQYKLAGNTTTPTVALLYANGKGFLRTEPKCPAAGNYTITDETATDPVLVTCSKSAAPDLHVLP
jgi:prepilin-type N-terminal cleavage/methylation domain-containing protein